jgi:hypothetical protein
MEAAAERGWLEGLVEDVDRSAAEVGGIDEHSRRVRPNASPSYTAPVAPLLHFSAELSTSNSAVGGVVLDGAPTSMFPAEIVPSSVSK